ncbi:hypothetical protein NDU88_001796 [Pleurodeles waltl]|uniref:Uncharacterized protein n=1 Tax=Pleurodeles waltl TaxID=8319 RepID=A0AAV7T0L3_PLEWA|nr:hypothetical protein NDU88_001796 [Pleurodeles waltl]
MTYGAPIGHLNTSRGSPFSASLHHQPPPAPASVLRILQPQAKAGASPDQHSSTGPPLQTPDPRQAAASLALTPLVTGLLVLLSGVPPPRLCPAALRQSLTCQQVPRASQEIQRHLAPRGALQCRSSSLLLRQRHFNGRHRGQPKSTGPPKVRTHSSRR